VTAKMPNCRLMPRSVEQMVEGDCGAVPVYALFADRENQVYIIKDIPLQRLAPGLVGVKLCKDGYHVDVSTVPSSHRWPRPHPDRWPKSFSRVHAITGACCGGRDC